jgi:hypothetical protein
MNPTSVLKNFEIRGPDNDGLLWLILHGHGTSGQAMVSLGSPARIAGQVALLLEEDRRRALASITSPELNLTDDELEQIAATPMQIIAEPANTAAADDVLAERRRQIGAYDYDLDHDDGHINDEIAALACYYAMPPAARDWDTTSTGYGDTLGEAILPARWVVPNPCDRRRELVKAGALILAEIERLDRAAGQPAKG